MDRVKLLQEIAHKEKDGIFVVNVPTAVSANKTVKKILENYADSKTAIFLSGGNTPKKLYEEIASEKTLRFGAALMIDERFGEKMHKKSNELMLKETGLLEYFENMNVRFYPILQNDIDLENTALQYDETLRFLFKYFPKSVGLLGLGDDGHTAGIPSGIKSHESRIMNPNDIVRKMMENQSLLVSFYELEGYGKRITMNFNALSMLDLILILVLGQEKREILNLMFKVSNLEEEIEKFPAKYYLKPEIASKTILITDQIV